MKFQKKEPVGNTCPTIDQAINRLNKIKESLEEACYGIDTIIDAFEELRSDNAALRDWGSAAVGEVTVLENRITEIEKELEALR